jgi:hypothetical protein
MRTDGDAPWCPPGYGFQASLRTAGFPESRLRSSWRPWRGCLRPGPGRPVPPACGTAATGFGRSRSSHSTADRCGERSAVCGFGGMAISAGRPGGGPATEPEDAVAIEPRRLAAPVPWQSWRAAAIAGGAIAMPVPLRPPVVVLVGSADLAHTRGCSPSSRPPGYAAKPALRQIAAIRSRWGWTGRTARLAAAEPATGPRGFMPPGAPLGSGFCGAPPEPESPYGPPGGFDGGVSGRDQTPVPPLNRDSSNRVRQMAMFPITPCDPRPLQRAIGGLRASATAMAHVDLVAGL